ncbi:unnamed protein product [Symbiodinium microadriaticum]|nr:unnamed protein product [Symbiodinium microadriaticum]
MPALRVCVSRNPEFAEAKSLPEVPEEARSSAKSALEQKVLKSMIWWKAAPPSVQRTEDASNILVADVWTIEGEHLPSYMVQKGYLLAVQEYEEELAKDILSVASAKEKQEQYQALEEALRATQMELETGTGVPQDSSTEAATASLDRGSFILGFLMLALVFALLVGLVRLLGSVAAPTSSKAKKTKKS